MGQSNWKGKAENKLTRKRIHAHPPHHEIKAVPLSSEDSRRIFLSPLSLGSKLTSPTWLVKK